MREQDQVLTPGERLREVLELRQWSQTDLAEIIGRPIQMVNEIIAGRRTISVETALDLQAALGTPTASDWLSWDAEHQLRQARHHQADAIKRRAELYRQAPVREMMRRNWIEQTSDDDVLAAELERFFTCGGSERKARGAAALFKGSSYATWTSAEEAWLCRSRQLAREIQVAEFTPDSVAIARQHLRLLRQDPADVGRIASVFKDVGIKFLVVQPLTGTRIDGVCFWEDETPVIVLSLRFDRIDNFWFVLLHELAHVRAGDGKTEAPLLDSDLESTMMRQDQVPQERDANRFASEELIPSKAIESFMAQVRPFYSRVRVERFSRMVNVHPGVVVGQLHHRGEVPYSNLRKLLAPVRELVITSARTDGWGRTIPPEGIR